MNDVAFLIKEMSISTSREDIGGRGFKTQGCGPIQDFLRRGHITKE